MLLFLVVIIDSAFLVIDFVLLIADFYIAYIYDETEMNENFPYEDLNLEELRPTVVDYETSEYKNILSRLSK